MKEKICIVAVVLAYAILCWYGWGSSSSMSTTTDGRTILTFWHTYGDDEELILRKVIGEWEALPENAKYTVRPVRIPFDGHKPKIRTALTVGQGPDMARVDWSFVCELARKNSVADLGTFGFDSIKGDYLEAPLNACCVDNKYYGLPDQSNCITLFYNRTIFKELGLLPQDSVYKFGEQIGGKPFPQNWADFAAFAKQFKDSSKGREPFAIMNTLWWNLAILNTFGAKVVDGNKCVIDSQASVDALNMIASLYKDGIEAGGWKPGAITPEQGFVNGKYVMILMGPWNLKRFKEDLKLDFGIALIPAGPAGTSSNVGGTDVVVFNDKPKERQEASYRFLTFFTNAQNQADWCLKLNQLPINTKAYALVNFEDEHQKAFMKQMQTTKPNPVVKDFGLLEDIVNPEVETILAGSKTAKQGVESITKRVQNLLNE
jgi:multiple sugar transport system substrate-binding protein